MLENKFRPINGLWKAISDPVNIRGFLTFALLFFSFSGISRVSTNHIENTAVGPERNAASERVFNTTIPLFGTWIGTLIAYYFAKENLDAATESNRRLTEALSVGSDKLEKIPVSAVINNRFLREYISAVLDSSAVTESDSDSREESGTIRERKIKKVLNKMDQYNRKRMPVFELEKIDSPLTGDKLRFLAYYDDMNKYCNEDDGATLSNFVSKFPEKNKAFIFVGKNICLAEANQERMKNQGCRDIFVTDSGLPSGKVIGYLTDIDIDQYRSST